MKKDIKRYLERHHRSSRRDLSFDKLVDVANVFFESVNTPKSLACYLALKYESYDSYLELGINPEDYDNPYLFKLDYQCVTMFKKSTFYPHIFDVRKEAISSFIRSEIDCYTQNSALIDDKDHLLADPAVNSIFHGAKRKIAIILGEVPCVSQLDLTFGPGNNVGLSKHTTVIDKLRSRPSCTSEFLELAPKVFEETPSWVSYLCKAEMPTLPLTGFVQVDVVTGSKLGFVPKNAKTDRSICTEPLLNSFVQLGIGRHMRRRLRRSGCDLRYQERNQELAREGSITNSLATIDLSSASDTISYMTVMELLPLPWFNLLDTCRSPHYTFEGKTYHFEKFSSMGNGFTFELETLIFLSLARATADYLRVPKDSISVYGDDIIIPVECVSLYSKVLRTFGFSVNESKSFSQGPFRESCGADWFLGQQVRPLYLKSMPTNASLMVWCNGIYRRSENLTDPHYRRWYYALRSLLPREFRKIKGPDGYGDGHLICDLNELPNIGISSYRKRGWEGYSYYTISSSPLHRRFEDQSVYVAALYSAYKCQGLPPGALSKAVSKSDLYLTNSRRSTRSVVRRSFHPFVVERHG